MKLSNDYTREQLFELAFHDRLTGVYNRNALEEKREAYDKTPLYVTMVDIDNLKTINDTFGHDAGDVIIKEVAEKLTSLAHDVIRLGGDEFLVLSNQPLKSPIAGASYGGVFKDVDTTLATAMKAADQRMYQVKHTKHA